MVPGKGAATRVRNAYPPEDDCCARPHESQLEQQPGIRTRQERPQAEPSEADRRKKNEREPPDEGRTAKEIEGSAD